MAATKTKESAVITPNALAEELFGKDGKVAGGKKIRAYLRAHHGRQLENKGSRWELPEDIAKEVRARFSAKEEPKAKAEAKA